MAIVYEHIRLDTNEVFYIGWGLTEKRAYEKGRNEHWQRVVDKAGYRVNIFATGLTPEDAKEVEIAEISRIGRSDLNKGPLTNKTDGGDGTINMSATSIDNMRQKKMGVKLREDTKEKIRLGNKGKKRSDESRIRYSESKIGDNNPAKRQEVREKISNSLKGRKVVGRVVVNKKKPNILECPHCKLKGNNNGGQMKRWHFNNCKSINKSEE
jgi:hypothetical protein